MDQATTDRACVQVFAKISASISHEIKNTLSIINENAGLLDDFAQMADEGSGVAVERVLGVTRTIAKQVDRSNIIMKNLSRFAHSTDSYLAHANLRETLTLMVTLTDRQAAMKNITTTLECPADIAFSGYLIVLESLIYLTLLSLFKVSTENSSLIIEVRDTAPDITICFTINQAIDQPFATYPDSEQKLLLNQVGGSCTCADNQLIIRLLANI